MQTFFSMQRSSTIKKNIGLFLGFIFFGIYLFLTDIFVVLSPMIGILFLRFSSSLRGYDFQSLFFILACLFFVELDKNIAFGSLFFCFVLLYFIAYNPLFYFFKNAFYFKMTFLCLIYFIFGLLILFFFDHSLDHFFEIFKLILGYILLEGLVVFFYEYKN